MSAEDRDQSNDRYEGRDAPARDVREVLGRDVAERIGPYTIVDTLGEGGMGVVFLAQQEEPVRRPVALKVIKPGMDTRQVVARFAAERQALAVMDHPNIAKVFDGGATESGLPYFVMELVRGEAITDYCDRQAASIRDRLELFLPVCEAIQHAHQKGVIHRDLKPSNIIIARHDGKPVPKVIDFGIAKAVDQRLSERTIQTQTGHLMGTPAYMSPEQAEGSGLDIDTRTDIYSLGVVLYQLLTGELPFTEKELQGLAALYTLLEKDPPTPVGRFRGLDDQRRATIARHRGTDPAVLERKLKGDINWIVMKAMEKDRAHRYETANALAYELRRYLNDEPVLARAPSAGYRVGKFVRRHRVGVAAAAALALAIIGSSIAISYLAIAATRSRDRADLRRGQAEELISFMVGDLRGKLEPVGRLEILDDVADKALEYFAAVPEEELTNQELFRRSQALSQLGQVRIAQGDLPAALRASQQALELSHDLAARDPDNGEWQVGLGAAYFWVGYVYWLQDDLDAALVPMQAYLDISTALVERDRENLDWQMELAYGYSNIGSIREARGDLTGALEAYRRTLEIKKLLAQREPDNPDWQFDLANQHNKIAVALHKEGDLAGALKGYRAEGEIRRALIERDSSNALWLEFHATNRHYMGTLLEDMGDLEGAAREYEADLEVTRALVARDSSNADWERGLAVSERALGRVLAEQNPPDRANQLLEDARSRFEKLLALDPTNTSWRRQLAASEAELGAAQLRTGLSGLAREKAERAIALLEPMVQADPQNRHARLDLAEAHLLLGQADAALGRREEARRAWTRALDTIEPLARESKETDYLATWALVLLELDRTQEATPLIDSLVERGFQRADLIALAEAKGVLQREP